MIPSSFITGRPAGFRLLAAIIGLASLVSFSTCGAAEENVPERPNIIFILADDLGVGDVKAFNPESKVATPSLNKLAAEGMVWRNAYCPDSVCTPSRYALMTGRYCWRTAHKKGVLANWEPPLIEEGRVTLPSLLRSAGYETAGFGKWHLGANFPTVDGKDPSGKGKYESASNGANIDLAKEVTGGPGDRGFDLWWGTLTPSEGLILDRRKPVAYLSEKAELRTPHLDELQAIALKDFLPEITRRAVGFISERSRSAKEPFFLYFAPYVPHIPLAVADGFRGSTQAGEYGDYVNELDDAIGQILAAVEKSGLADRTLVFFASDNGSQWETTGSAHHHPNGILRGGKWSIFEGGVRTPLMVRWPGRIPAGSSTDQLAALTDVLATVAAVTKTPLPGGAAEDSISFLPVLLGEKTASERESVVVKSTASSKAIRKGKWKYINAPAKDGAQLYDLQADPSEQNDVHEKYPEVAAELKAELKAINSTGQQQ